MEEIKQYINLQMRKMLEIFEKIIKFDIFFQEKEFKKSKSIFSYIVFIFLSVGSYISIFPERLVINTNLLSNPKTILFILLIYISYITSFFNDNIFKYCRAELLEENYFHSIFEAAKSIFDRLRELTGLEQDGAKLIDTVFSIDRPLLVINGLCTDSEKSEHKGFATLLKGIYGTFRNPFAHAAKIKWATSETDALDILSTISFVHRRLDEAQKTCFASIS